MSNNKTVVYILALLVLCSTMCKARYVNDNFDEDTSLETRNNLIKRVFQANLDKRECKGSGSRCIIGAKGVSVCCPGFTCSGTDKFSLHFCFKN
jgi:hypothetical protein